MHDAKDLGSGTVRECPFIDRSIFLPWGSYEATGGTQALSFSSRVSWAIAKIRTMQKNIEEATVPMLMPPFAIGLVRRSPNVAPNGLVKTKASQKSHVPETFVKKCCRIIHPPRLFCGNSTALAACHGLLIYRLHLRWRSLKGVLIDPRFAVCCRRRTESRCWGFPA